MENMNAVIKVIGVGGAGNNAINRMVEEEVMGVDFIACNTDAQVLETCKTENRIILGKDSTKGLGAGADPEIGKKAAEESEAEIKEYLKGTDMIFITAGMGGGTGTGAAPVIARMARDMGILVVGVVTRPFTFEGKGRTENARNGIEALKESVDSIIIIPNDKLFEVIDRRTPMKEAFLEADNILRQGVQGITDLIYTNNLINLDFADLTRVIKNKGAALIGIGYGKGENAAVEAAMQAIESPLLEVSIDGATHAIINVTGGEDLGLYDAQDAIAAISNSTTTELDVIFGACTNPELEEEVVVTVIATGYEDTNFDLGQVGNKFVGITKPKQAAEPQRSAFHTSNQVLNTEEISLLDEEVAVEPEVREERVETVEQQEEGTLGIPAFLRRKK